MKFNPNQRYTRWSIRRLSVGVASVVVASATTERPVIA